MIISSFIFCGFICTIGQILLDNTKMTYGHITSLFVIFGAFLGTFGLYDSIIKYVGVGANIPIMSFGNSLTNGAYDGFLANGFIGLFSGMLSSVSTGIVSVVVFSFILMIVFKTKD